MEQLLLLACQLALPCSLGLCRRWRQPTLQPTPQPPRLRLPAAGCILADDMGLGKTLQGIRWAGLGASLLMDAVLLHAVPPCLKRHADRLRSTPSGLLSASHQLFLCSHLAQPAVDAAEQQGPPAAGRRAHCQARHHLLPHLAGRVSRIPALDYLVVSRAALLRLKGTAGPSCLLTRLLAVCAQHADAAAVHCLLMHSLVVLNMPPQQLGQRVPEVAQGAGAHAAAVRELARRGAGLHLAVPVAPQPVPGRWGS